MQWITWWRKKHWFFCHFWKNWWHLWWIQWQIRCFHLLKTKVELFTFVQFLAEMVYPNEWNQLRPNGPFVNCMDHPANTLLRLRCYRSYLFHMAFSLTEICFDVNFSTDTWHDNRSVFFGILADCLFWICKYITSLVAIKLLLFINPLEVDIESQSPSARIPWIAIRCFSFVNKEWASRRFLEACDVPVSPLKRLCTEDMLHV